MELNLVGQAYEAGFEDILQKAIQKGLIQNDSQIHVLLTGMKVEITFERLGCILHIRFI